MLRNRGTDRRLAVIDSYEIPASVRSRFSFHYPELSAAAVSTVEAGTRQWFRLVARNPKGQLAMPSLVVDDMWHEMVLHTREYAEFCDTAFGRFVHHTPESAMTESAASENRGSGLAVTYRLAKQDEPGGMPLLFRVDGELGVEGGRHYLADCGGRGQCFDMPGVVCLEHISGAGKGYQAPWSRDRAADSPQNYPEGGGGGGMPGCGGGGCGGN
jgi:hypothetical protein